MRLAVEGLTITYPGTRGRVAAVRDVTLSVGSGHTLGLVGESGSGKSSLGLALLRLLPEGTDVRGHVWLGEEDLLTVTEDRMRQVRGRTVGMVFQDSLAALNPAFTIGNQLVETIRRHDPSLSRRAAREQAGDTLEELGIPRSRLRSFPHEFSGGMRQRAMIAAALAPRPSFLVADECTSDLDTVSQRTILDLLASVQQSRGLGLIVVSHDLGVVHHLCEEVAVLYRGDLVEHGPTRDVLVQPRHEYTRGLVWVSAKKRRPDGRLYTLPSRGRAEREAEVGA